MLCLSQLENATPEDRDSGLYQWAKIFKATTWKELIDLSKNNSILEGTVVTMANLSNEECIRQQCERREKFERDRINAMNYSFNQGHSAGLAEGRKEGLRDGRAEGFQLLSILIQKLNDAGRSSEILQVTSDTEYRNKLLKEFGLI